MDMPVYLFGWAVEISSTRWERTSSPSSPWMEFSLCSSFCRRRRHLLLLERSTAQEIREQLHHFQWDRSLAAPVERRRISSGDRTIRLPSPRLYLGVTVSPRVFSSAHVQDIAATTTTTAGGGGVHPYYKSEWGDFFFYSILCDRAVIDRGVGSEDDLLQTCRHPGACEGLCRSRRTDCEPDGQEAKRELAALPRNETYLLPGLSCCRVLQCLRARFLLPPPSPPLRLQVLLYQPSTHHHRVSQ